MLRPPPTPKPPGRAQLKAAAVVQAAMFLHVSVDESAALSRRYGLNGARGTIDLQVIADELGVRVPTVRRLLASGGAKLRALPAVRRAFEGLIKAGAC